MGTKIEWDHIINNGTIVTPHSSYKAHIYIKDGKIAAITQDILEGASKEITDSEGYYILPGLIDTHIHSRDKGATHKEDFYHSTMAAAIGGVTTVFEMPNTTPPINNRKNFEDQVDNLSKKAHVNFAIWGICLGDLNLDDLQDLDKAGVIAFKYFWGYAIEKDTYKLIYNYSSEMENVIPPCDDGEVYAMMREVAKTGKIFAVHAENSALINLLTKEAMASWEAGNKDYDTVISSRPTLAEVLTSQTGIAMAKETGVRFHILHVASAEVVDIIQEAQRDGYDITCETCPHYLFLSAEDYESIGPLMKAYPLVKYKHDQERLWQGIKEDTISLICSDHAPHTEAEKAGDIWEIPAGMCGVETIVPLMLNAVSEGKLSLNKLVTLMAQNPAEKYSIFPKKGAIQIGSDADLTLVDMEKEFTIKRENLHSKSKVTAYDGFKVKGMPVATIVNGVTVMKNGKILATDAGQFINPNKY